MDVAMTSRPRRSALQLRRAGGRRRAVLRGLRRRARPATPTAPAAGHRHRADGRDHPSAPSQARASPAAAPSPRTGYCETCGAKAANPRDHFAEQPAPWVAGVCDRGIRHSRNEDAMAIAADAEPGSRALLVVCDGVTRRSTPTSPAWPRPAPPATCWRPGTRRARAPSRRAAVRSWPGSRRLPTRPTTPYSRPRVRTVRTRRRARSSPLSLEDGLLVAGVVGDSRAYWLPDDGEAGGADRGRLVGRRADRGRHPAGGGRVRSAGARDHPLARARTPRTTHPRTTTLAGRPGRAGCWSARTGCGTTAPRRHRAGRPGPPDRCGARRRAARHRAALVDWANAQGGQDNITVALARGC